MASKQCPRCGALKNLTEFAREGGGWHRHCAPCHAELLELFPALPVLPPADGPRYSISERQREREAQLLENFSK